MWFPWLLFLGGVWVFWGVVIRLGLKNFLVGCLVLVVVAVLCIIRVFWGVRSIRVGFGLLG